MKKETMMDDYKHLSTAERLRMMEALWDSFQYEDIETPAWHGEILEQRKKSIRQGRAEFISLTDLKAMSDK